MLPGIEKINPDLSLLTPQLIVLGLSLLLLLIDAVVPRWRGAVMAYLTLIGYAAALVATFFMFDMNESTFYGMIRADDFSAFVNVIVLVAGILSVLVSINYMTSRAEPGSMPVPEYYALISFSILGAMIVGAAGDLVIVFLGIEMSSLAVYALTGFARHRITSLEGALKYFLLGLFASAILLYGMAWTYGATGTTNLSEIAAELANYDTSGNIEASLLLAVLLLIVGLGFKVAAVPFHMWTPDAYQGAPTPVSAYMSVIPKAAGFAAMVRLLVQALEPLADEWTIIIAILAVVTMFFGNIVAIAQTDIKRMLAYSSIGHTGYMLAAVAAYGASASIDDDLSVTSLLFYLLAYAFMNIGAFAIVTWLQDRGRGVDLSDFRGLASQSPVAALMMTVFLLSLTGLPPLVGFYAKYYVILATVDAGMIWLAVAIVLASAASAFYYLRVIATMYFAEAEQPEPVGSTPWLGAGLLAMVAGTILVGIFSGRVFDLAQGWVDALTIIPG
ncbi:MAG TPA: NADH-quinone oxidoreductase subunit N [Thermomicrobiales bacterium]|nr:NADH-quinone oxidoreductase subunit N [Thermomicrobiales bacterium]